MTDVAANPRAIDADPPIVVDAPEAAPTAKPKTGKPFKASRAQVPYVKPGEARRLELAWQRFVHSRAVESTWSYAARRGLTAIEEIVPCLICGSDYFKLALHPTKKDWEYDVVLCDDCGLMYRNPNIIPEHLHTLYDGVNYNNFLSGDYGKSRQDKYRSVLHSFRDVLPKDAAAGRDEPLSVLDFGCGNGLALEIMQSRGYETMGIDLSPESVEVARERLGHDNIWCGAPSDIAELEGRQFDVITMWSVLAHLPRPIDTLSELRSYLKPGGALLVFTVNANSLLLKQDRDRWNGFTRNHLAFYTAETANLLFRKAGFAEVLHRPHFSNHAGNTSKGLPVDVWNRWQLSVLEHRGGNMNRMMAFNPSIPTDDDAT